MEEQSAITLRWSAVLVCLQRGNLYILPLKEALTPRLCGVIPLRTAVLSTSAGAKKAAKAGGCLAPLSALSGPLLSRP